MRQAWTADFMSHNAPCKFSKTWASSSESGILRHQSEHPGGRVSATTQCDSGIDSSYRIAAAWSAERWATYGRLRSPLPLIHTWEGFLKVWHAKRIPEITKNGSFQATRVGLVGRVKIAIGAASSSTSWLRSTTVEPFSGKSSGHPDLLDRTYTLSWCVISRTWQTAATSGRTTHYDPTARGLSTIPQPVFQPHSRLLPVSTHICASSIWVTCTEPEETGSVFLIARRSPRARSVPQALAKASA